MPQPVASAAAFVHDGKAYIFGGRTQDGTYQNRLWCYQPDTDTWTDLGNTPLKPRVNPVAITGKDRIYIGLGYNGKIYTDSCYLRDFWAYSPADNTWQQLTDYPSTATDKCIAFATDTMLYVGCGFYNAYNADMYTYHIGTNTWTLQEGSRLQRPEEAFAMTGATAQNRFYTGTGYRLKSLNQWLEYSPQKGRFLRRSSMPDKGRDCAVATGGQAHIYVFGGQRFGGTLTTLHYYDDIMRYSVATDSWELCSAMPQGGLVNMVAFTIGSRVYFGLGEDINNHINASLYCFEE